MAPDPEFGLTDDPSVAVAVQVMPVSAGESNGSLTVPWA